MLFLFFYKNDRKDFIKKIEKDKIQMGSTYTTAKIKLIVERGTSHLSKETIGKLYTT